MRVNVDFENAFNSVPHENLWTVLRAFKIPDIDLLEAIYSVATVSLAQSQGSGGGITFDTGVQQGRRVLWDQGARDLRRLARERSGTQEVRILAPRMSLLFQNLCTVFCYARTSPLLH